MAAVAAGVNGLIGASGAAGSGVIVSLLLLLLLSVLLAALCSDCNRQSFELQDSMVEKNPSTLISVLKLEDAIVAKENPMINEIQNDEKDFTPSEENSIQFTPWRCHLGAPQNNQGVWPNGRAAVMETTPVDSNTTGESSTEEESSIEYMAWRSHLGAHQQQDHIYHTIEEGNHTNTMSSTTSHTPEQNDRESITQSETPTGVEVFSDSRPIYAQVSKKSKPALSPVQTPEALQVKEEAEEELSPPLPHRHTEVDA